MSAGLADIGGLTLALLVLAGVLAGFVDAVVGGGGLIQLPALLLGLPGATPAQLLATNKLAAVAGTSLRAVTYARRVPPHWPTAIPLVVAAFAGALGGAVIGLHIPKAAFTPIVLALLVLVGAYTLLTPQLGEATVLRHSGTRHTAAAAAVGLVIGTYDGALGPGTGSFLVIALVGWLGYAFLEGTAHAKIANVATNLGALAIFVPGSHVLWVPALVMAAGNVLGGYLGARVAVRFGSRFVKAVFVVVVGAMIVRLGGQVLGFW